MYLRLSWSLLFAMPHLCGILGPSPLLPPTMVHYAQASLGSLSSRPWDLGKTHPVNHRSHIWAKHIQSTKSHVWAKHTQSTKKVVSGQNTPSQPQKSYLGKPHPVNNESYIWAKHIQSTTEIVSEQNTPKRDIWANDTKSTTKVIHTINHESQVEAICT